MLATLVLVSTPSLASPPATAPAPEGGVAYFTDQLLENDKAPSCPFTPRYQATADPAKAAPGKAYGGDGYGPGSCPALFTYIAPADFRLSGNARVSFWA